MFRQEQQGEAQETDRLAGLQGDQIQNSPKEKARARSGDDFVFELAFVAKPRIRVTSGPEGQLAVRLALDELSEAIWLSSAEAGRPGVSSY